MNKTTILSQVIVRESLMACPLIMQVSSLEELGTMSENNLRGITLGLYGGFTLLLS